MEFQVKLNDINMKLIANTITDEKIEDEDFEIPEGYKSISKETMEEIIESFNSFSKDK